MVKLQSVSINNIKGRIIAKDLVHGLNLEDPEIRVEKLGEAAPYLVLSSSIDQTRLVGCGVAVCGVADGNRGAIAALQPAWVAQCSPRKDAFSTS